MAGARIAVIGDYREDHETHPATTAAISGLGATPVWIGTDAYSGIDGFDGVWIAPGSPYRDPEAAFEAIRAARTTDTPLIGTCAGFQHMVIEYARNVLGVADAQHGEYDPDATHLFITGLACSLAGLEMKVHLVAGTRASIAYGCEVASERYYCNFGLNPSVLPDLVAAGLVVGGVDQDGEVRIVEVIDARFFVGTLFVPQVSPGVHPLVAAFVRAASDGDARRRG
jgi:CTP synthase (UTP-ammonia lyase)